jgi:hypothetical protein
MMCESIDNNVELSQYADDTLIFISGFDVKHIIKQLSSSIERLVEYFGAHHLTVNVDKTKFLIFGKKKDTASIPTADAVLIVNGDCIKPVTDAKYLGVKLDQNLTFQPQISLILQKMALGIRTIYAMRDLLPLRARLVLLETLVLSHVNYPILLLTHITNTQLNSLEKQLNWALKACYYKSKFDSATELKLKSSILPIRLLVNMRCAIYFSKILHDELPAFQIRKFPNSDFKFNNRTHKVNIKTGFKTDFL